MARTEDTERSLISAIKAMVLKLEDLYERSYHDMVIELHDPGPVEALENQVTELQGDLRNAVRDIQNLLRDNESSMGDGLLRGYRDRIAHYERVSAFSPKAARALDAVAKGMRDKEREKTCGEK